MANTINSELLEKIITKAQVVLRQKTPLLSMVGTNFTDDFASKGTTISAPVAAPITTADITPANTAPSPADISISAQTLSLAYEKKAPFKFSATESQKYSLDKWMEQQVENAVKYLVKDINDSVWSKYYQIPYFKGDSGTGIFASGSLAQMGQIRRLLIDNENDSQNLTMCVSTKDYADLLSASNFVYANYRGSDDIHKTGMITDFLGFKNIMEDIDAPTHTIGNFGSGGTATAAATAAGLSTVTVAVTVDAIALKQGDIIRFGDGYNYSLQADVSVASGASGTFTLDRGLEAPLAGTETAAFATDTGTFDANSLVNIAGDFRGIGIGARRIAALIEGYAIQGTHIPFNDPVTGFPLTLSIYPQYHQTAFEVSALWGTAIMQSKMLARVLTYSS